MRSPLFWNVTQRRLVVTDVAVQPIGLFFKSQGTAWYKKMGPIGWKATSVTNYQSTLRDIPRRAEISRLNSRWSWRLLSQCILLVCLLRHTGWGRELYSRFAFCRLLFLWQPTSKSEPGSIVLVKLTSLNIICRNSSWRRTRWRRKQWFLVLTESCTL